MLKVVAIKKINVHMFFLIFSGDDLKNGPHTLTGDTVVRYTPPTDTGNKCNLHGK